MKIRRDDGSQDSFLGINAILFTQVTVYRLVPLILASFIVITNLYVSYKRLKICQNYL